MSLLRAVKIYSISYGLMGLLFILAGMIPVILFRFIPGPPWPGIILFIISFELLRFWPYYATNRWAYKKWEFSFIFIAIAFTSVFFGLWNSYGNVHPFKDLPRTQFSEILGTSVLAFIQGVVIPLLFWFKIRKRRKLEEEEEETQAREHLLLAEKKEGFKRPFESTELDTPSNPLYTEPGKEEEEIDPLYRDSHISTSKTQEGRPKSRILKLQATSEIVFDEESGRLRKVKIKSLPEFEDSDREEDDDYEDEIEPRMTTYPPSAILVLAYWCMIGVRVLGLLFPYETNLYFFLGGIPMILLVYFMERNQDFSHHFHYIIFFVFFLDAFLALLPGGEFIIRDLRKFSIGNILVALGIMGFLYILVFVHRIAAQRATDMASFPYLVFLGQSFKNTFFNLFFVSIPNGYSNPLYWLFLGVQALIILVNNTGLMSYVVKAIYRSFRERCMNVEESEDEDEDGSAVYLYKEQTKAEALVLLSWQDFVTDNLLLAAIVFIAFDYWLRLGYKTDECHVSCAVNDPVKLGNLVWVLLVTWVVKAICHIIAFKIVSTRFKQKRKQVALTEEGTEVTWKLSRKETVIRHVKRGWPYFTAIVFFTLQYVQMLLAENEDTTGFMRRQFDIEGFLPHV